MSGTVLAVAIAVPLVLLLACGSAVAGIYLYKRGYCGRSKKIKPTATTPYPGPDPPTGQNDLRPICQYDGSCLRKNPVHYSQFRHPLSSALPLCPSLAAGTVCRIPPHNKEHFQGFNHNPTMAPCPIAPTRRWSSETGGANRRPSDSSAAIRTTRPAPAPAGPAVEGAPDWRELYRQMHRPEMGEHDAFREPNCFHESEVKLFEVIGKGAFGEVWKASVNQGRYGGDPAAIAALKTCSAEAQHAALYREAVMMAQAPPSSNLVYLLGVVVGHSPKLILTYCEYGSLLERLRRPTSTEAAARDSRVASHEGQPPARHGKTIGPAQGVWPRLTLADRLGFSLDIAAGMQQLAQMRIVHMDLAARNVLVDGGMVCRVSDFGLSRNLEKRQGRIISEEGKQTQRFSDTDTFEYETVAGAGQYFSPAWTAPEAIASSKFSVATDTWSYGVVLFEIYTNGARPYGKMKMKEMLEFVNSGQRLKRPVLCPPRIYNEIMLACWEKMPWLRPSFSEVARTLTSWKQDCASVPDLLATSVSLASNTGEPGSSPAPAAPPRRPSGSSADTGAGRWEADVSPGDIGTGVIDKFAQPQRLLPVVRRSFSDESDMPGDWDVLPEPPGALAEAGAEPGPFQSIFDPHRYCQVTSIPGVDSALSKPRLLILTPAEAPLVERIRPALIRCYDIDHVTTVADAIELVKSNTFKCVLIKMSEGTRGAEVVRALRHGPHANDATHIAVYSYTASTTPSIREKLSTELGVNTFYHRATEAILLKELPAVAEAAALRRALAKPMMLIWAPGGEAMVERLYPKLTPDYEIDHVTDLATARELIEANTYACVLIKLSEGTGGKSIAQSVRRQPTGATTEIVIYSYTACTDQAIQDGLVADFHLNPRMFFHRELEAELVARLTGSRGPEAGPNQRPKLLLWAPANALMASRLSAQVGTTFEVFHASSLAVAKDLVAAHFYTCVLVKSAEGSSGKDVIRAVRARPDGAQSQIVVYSYTASTTPAIRDELTTELGVNLFFHRATEDALVAKLNSLGDDGEGPSVGLAQTVEDRARLLLCMPEDATLPARLRPELEMHFNIDTATDSSRAMALVETRRYVGVLVKMSEGEAFSDFVAHLRKQPGGGSTFVAVYSWTAYTTPEIRSRLESELGVERVYHRDIEEVLVRDLIHLLEPSTPEMMGAGVAIEAHDVAYRANMALLGL